MNISANNLVVLIICIHKANLNNQEGKNIHTYCIVRIGEAQNNYNKETLTQFFKSICLIDRHQISEPKH